jgi:hypothetical protein
MNEIQKKGKEYKPGVTNKLFKHDKRDLKINIGFILCKTAGGVFQIVAQNKRAPLTHPDFASLVTPLYVAEKGKRTREAPLFAQQRGVSAKLDGVS